ncbi:Na+/H+ antiporter subunit D [Cellulomonas wangsupingiae]|uniref:Na+/H+ antiporter subunit D n=1 Tax=Cellulomonas wangsupingiae TaxID=2968085 RepID=A0ABY5K543_9CELL|nr:Na+/H+ antiporter subunit D [Cellulomonas wangsupingiae]MCC2334868.1 Na+/H+ antiporter subunit D [Cellulomonas wangsupingiae]MCM0638741.1 Na+/H+ antiporter subunit D [Cellulomonas wangsupingiae]UUI65369.1 Na+/H+ antiporter subunit D [Cellulomonas wangsupingiae]
MTDWGWLVPLPVVLPLSAAGLALALYRRPRLQRIVTLVTLTLVAIVSGALLVLADAGPVVVEVGDWAAPVGINLVADRLSALMLTVSSVVILCVLVYSLAQDREDGERFAPISIFHPTYLVLSAGVANAFLSGDLFNIYVGFEILLAASYVLITLSGTTERIRAGTIYVVVAILSSVLFLVAIAAVYAAVGTVNLAQLAIRLPEIDPGVRLVLQAMLLMAFGIKAAVFPLSAWLPDSYPTAPAPVTAVFAGLLTKVGVYAIIRTQTLLFPGGRLDDILMWVALATMVVGILGAVAQDDVKRLLSFTLVSHIGYMVFGVALGSVHGWTAAIYYVAHHITVQTALFLVVGLVERFGGTTSLDRLGGLAKMTPVLAVLFFVPAMNLGGIPPLSGFLGKVGLLEAGVELGTPTGYALVVGSVVTSLLTLYALIKAWNKAFWQSPPEPLPANHVPAHMVVPTAALVVFSLALTVFAGPLYAYTGRAAQSLADRLPYIEAVLPDGQRGEGESQRAADEGADDPDGAEAEDTRIGGDG